MRKFTHQEVECFYNQEGYLMLSEYVDCKTRIEYMCPSGHAGAGTFDNFKRGKRCPICRRNEAAVAYATPVDKVRSDFIDRGLTPLFSTYKNNRQKLPYVCTCGNKSLITYGQMLRGRRCNVCGTQRRVDTLYRNGHIPISTQQRLIHSIVSGELNYQTGKVFLDIAFPSEKIYVEYDGSGHALSVHKGDMTQARFDKKEVRRRYALYRSGWREIRFVSKKDKLPSEDVIRELFELGRSILENNSYCVFDFDNGTMEYGQKVFDVDFGELTRIRKS